MVFAIPKKELNFKSTVIPAPPIKQWSNALQEFLYCQYNCITH